MKKTIICISLFLLCMAVFCSCNGKNKISFGTGNTGGNYYSYGNAYAQLISADDENISVDVKSTAGSSANLRLIQQGFLDIAIVQSDTLMDAYNGDGAFSDIPCTEIRALAGLYTEECQVVVRAESDIYSISDLYGKRVSVGEEESGVSKNAEQIMQVNGILSDMADRVYLSFSDEAKALKEGTIDAFFCTAGSPAPYVSELAESTAIRIISLDETTISRITDEYSGYTVCTILAGTYAGQTEDIQTVGIKAVLAAGNDISDDTAKMLVNTLFSHSAELQAATGFSELNPDFAVNDIPVPFHEGAAQWYAQQGITVNTDADSTVQD